jgi:hypothetical protein
VEPVARISKEQLVAAVAGQRDRHRSSGDLRHQIRRHRRGVRERLVEHVGEPVDDAEHLPLVARLLVVLGVQMAGDGRGVIRLVELGIVEADRERLDRDRALLLHQRDDQGRVDAAREKASERHVGNHALPHGGRQQGVELRLCFCLGHRCLPEGIRDRIPVAAHRQCAVLEEEEMRGRQLPDAGVDRVRRRYVAVAQVQPHRVGINLARHRRIGDDRLQLGGKPERAA